MADPLLALFGYKASNLVAGLFGGMVRSLVLKGGIVPTIISSFVGGVTATYLAPPLTLAPINYWMMPESTVGFLVGVTAMALCEGLMKSASAFRFGAKRET